MTDSCIKVFYNIVCCIILHLLSLERVQDKERGSVAVEVVLSFRAAIVKTGDIDCNDVMC